MRNYTHYTVMKNEAVDALNCQDGKIYVDCTLGGGGHSELILQKISPDGKLMEILELPNLDWFVASQFHPEFKSRPERPHPLFKGLIDTAVKKLK